MGKRENAVQNGAMVLIQHEYGCRDVTMFRTNSGKARAINSENRIKLAPKGTGDFVLCAFGAYFEFEAKADDGKQSEQQAIRQASVERAGGTYIIFWTPQEALDKFTAALQARGLPPPTQAQPAR